MLRRHQPDEVVIEAPLAPNQVNKRTNDDTITVLKGIPFAIQGYLHMHGFFNVSLAVVKDIRMHFIGRNPKGEIAKPLVWEKCRAMGWIMPEDVDYRSTDRTDALAGWSYVETKLFPRLATPVDDLWVAVQQKKRRGRDRGGRQQEAGGDRGAPLMNLQAFSEDPVITSCRACGLGG